MSSFRPLVTEAAAEASPRARWLRVIARVQELISDGAPTEHVFQAVVDGAVDLLDGYTGSLRFVDRDDPGWMVAVATRDVTGFGERWRQRSPITEGTTGRAITTGRLAVLHGGERESIGSTLAPAGTQAAMAVPLREHGEVVGSLVVGSDHLGRQWTDDEQALFTAYGRHVEVALAVARASDGLMQALTDPLTGLANRPALLDRLEHRLAQADRGGAPVSVLFLDLDRFKLVNDSLGHAVGDELLVEVSARLRRCLRREDVCARLGGDEFAVLLADRTAAVATAKRIIDALSAGFTIAGHELFVTVSVGVATGQEEAATLLRNADMAMYDAKRTAPGTYACFVPAMHAAKLSRLDLHADLRRAVENEQFELRYQPLVELCSGSVVGFECLVRWRHSQRGLLTPGDFIPVAEETGVIVEIDHWVIQEAGRQLAEWSAHAPLMMSANVSVPTLYRPGYADTVRRALNQAFAPSALIVEVTETADLVGAPAALAGLRAVKNLGVRIALDDFGTGYSSLASLAQLPVDILKIPRPFVATGAAHGSIDPSRMLTGIIALGRHLGLTTVAEGIETETQRDLVAAHGCDLGQGYLLGRPLEARDAEALLRRESPDSFPGAPAERCAQARMGARASAP